MTREGLLEFMQRAKGEASGWVRQYAAVKCPLVPTWEIDAIVSALGNTVTLDEAFNALDRLQTTAYADWRTLQAAGVR